MYNTLEEREDMENFDDDETDLVMFDDTDVNDIEQTIGDENRLTQKASNNDLQDVVNVYAQALIQSQQTEEK